MIIRQPNQSDWEMFSALASSENWRVPRSELQLFKGPWSQFSHVLDDNGFCGLVTAIAYEKSAWIGNLIVPGNLRRKGYGQHLFKSVLADLVGRGMTSIWLTASDQGHRLYAREGFIEVDRVERWVLSPSGGVLGSPETANNSCEKLLHADSLAWGENRSPLLPALCKDGNVFAVENAVAMLQPGPDLQVVGPWYSNDASLHANQLLLTTIIAAANPFVDVFMDMFGSSPLRPVCESSGFKCTGQTSLMVFGDVGSIDFKSMVSIASLGSVG